MRITYCNSAPRPSTANSYMSSALLYIELTEYDANNPQEVVTVDSAPTEQTLFTPPEGNRWTALELADSLAYSEKLHVPELFYLLRSLPCLENLTIYMTPGETVLAPKSTDIVAVPFSLRRLLLSVVFPGWIYLLRNSRDTLECLSLGCRQWGPPADRSRRGAPRYADTCEGVSLGEFTKLSALRLEDPPEPRLLAACARLSSLTVMDDATYLSVVQLSLPGPLMRLKLVYIAFTDLEAVKITRAIVDFAVFRVLRSLVVEVIDRHDDLKLTGRPGRMALADACRGRRIALSVVRVLPYCEWEKLPIASRRGT